MKKWMFLGMAATATLAGAQIVVVEGTRGRGEATNAEGKRARVSIAVANLSNQDVDMLRGSFEFAAVDRNNRALYQVKTRSGRRGNLPGQLEVNGNQALLTTAGSLRRVSRNGGVWVPGRLQVRVTDNGKPGQSNTPDKVEVQFTPNQEQAISFAGSLTRGNLTVTDQEVIQP